MTAQTTPASCAACRHYKPVRQHQYGERYDGVCTRQSLRVYNAQNGHCRRFAAKEKP